MQIVLVVDHFERLVWGDANDVNYAGKVSRRTWQVSYTLHVASFHICIWYMNVIKDAGVLLGSTREFVSSTRRPLVVLCD